MNWLSKFSKKLFASKYSDLVVITIVFLSVILLVFESLSGFVINPKTIELMKGVIEEDKLDCLKTLYNKRFAQEELKSLLVGPWREIYNEKELILVDKMTVDAIRSIRFKKYYNKYSPLSLASLWKNREDIKKYADETEVIASNIYKLRNNGLSPEELMEDLKLYGFNSMEIEKILIHSERTKGHLTDRLYPDKIRALKLLEKDKLPEKELIEYLKRAQFSNKEISIVFKYTEKILFSKKEINIILKFSKLLFPISGNLKDIIIKIDDLIILFFILELTLRYFSCVNFKEFICRYWIDILSVITLFRIFRLSRIFIVMRLFRVFSFAVLLGRHLSFFSSNFARRWIDFILTMLFLIFMIAFGTISLNSVELERHPTTEHAFWSTVYTLFSGQYIDDFPDTLVGKLSVLVMIIAGMSFFAILIGTVSAIMMEKFKEGIIMSKTNFDILENHIIICGWQEKAPQIINELHAMKDYKNTNMVIISDMKDFLNTDLERFKINTGLVYLIEGDFTDPEILRKANIDKAKIAIILPDRSAGRSNRDIDARTVLTALTLEKLNPRVYSCAELLEEEYESHMKVGKVNEVIIGGYYSGLIAAHSAINENLVPLLKGILPAKADHKLDNIKVSQDIIGKEFGEVIEKMRKDNSTLPIGVKTATGDLLINPGNYIIQQGDFIVGLVSKT